MTDEEGELNYQCWICPFCYDDHRQDRPCKQEDLHEEITKLRTALEEAMKDIE
jgi:hypothetical protein